MNDETTWNECLESNVSIKVSPDKAKAKSLIDTALGRVQYCRESAVKESNANYLFENYYSSVLELLHALVLFYGYSVGNHICLGYYIKEILKREELFRLFDDCRYKRNSLVYFGRKMDFIIAQDSIKKCEKLIQELRNILEKEMKQKL